jgi:hypothetical protein
VLYENPKPLFWGVTYRADAGFSLYMGRTEPLLGFVLEESGVAKGPGLTASAAPWEENKEGVP